MHIQTNIEEQATLSLSAVAFHHYLRRHGLEPLRVALAAGVRYLTVWKIGQGLPITRRDETLVRQGLGHLTGESYTAPILVQEMLEHGQREQAHKASVGRMSWR